jgi:hypothetical protein
MQRQGQGIPAEVIDHPWRTERNTQVRTISSGVMGPQTRTRDVLADERAVETLRRILGPQALSTERVEPWLDRPISLLVLVEEISDGDQDQLWAELSEVPRPNSHYPPAILPDPNYEQPDVPRGSAVLDAPDAGLVNVPYEIRLSGPAHGNPFVDVDVTAQFSCEHVADIRVGGFYDGGGAYVVRFLPPAPGIWVMTTSSTARSLDQIQWTFEVDPSTARGPVRVAETFHFAYDNGEAYVPIGTTAYAWTHQTEDLQEETLDTLRSSPFTKVRMCIFPKHIVFNDNDPETYPFERTESGFDLTTFDVEFFRHLERRIEQLQELGIEADLILFHPYDRWGFMTLGPVVDERFVTYVVRRLAAYPNVWWSLANEYDFVWSKDLSDWEHLAAVVQGEDHAQHLLSIHNGVYIYDYAAPWATHCSIQKVDERVATMVTEWRRTWNKPVIFDEACYEGDLEYDWGNITAAEMTRRFWDVTARGGYITHGETYWNEDETIFWAKGGKLSGESVSRIAFLSEVIAESPTKRLESLTTGLSGTSAGAPGEYEVHYFGSSQPRVKTITVPEGVRAYIDVIDSWEMTVTTLEGTYVGTVAIPLPGKPFMAIRVRAA